MKIAIVVYSMPKYSETFLNNHINNLASLVLLSSEFPIYTSKFGIKSIKNYIKEKLLKRKLKKNNINIILAEYGIIGAEIHPFTSKNNMHLATEFRGYDLSVKRYLDLYKDRYTKLLSQGQLFIVKSSEMKHQLIEMGASKNKIKVIPSGYDASVFFKNRFSKKSDNFVFIGRFTEKKAPSKILEAFSKIEKKLSPTKLIMIGCGELLEGCKRQTKALGIEHKVEFLGEKSPNEIAQFFDSSFALVNHSVTAPNGDKEGLPNVILEAMASGLPVIATNHGGIPDVISHGETGFLVDEHDTNGLAEYMLKIGRDKELAKNIGFEARRKVSSKYTSAISLQRLRLELKYVVHEK